MGNQFILTKADKAGWENNKKWKKFK